MAIISVGVSPEVFCAGSVSLAGMHRNEEYPHVSHWPETDFWEIAPHKC
jgi:hypothetical protein